MTSIPGLPTIQVNGPFWSAEVELVSVTTPPALAPGELLIERFSRFNADQDPPNWVDTKRDNSFEEKPTLFKTFLRSNQVVYGTKSTAVNIHSHYVAPGVLNWTNYIYTGRMFITNSEGGVGVTFFSRYPENEDSYYRLRTTNIKQTFHIAPHPHEVRTVDQEKYDSGITPKASTWYRFHIEVEDAGDRTNIRAKIWEEGSLEPDEFQMETFDDSDDRLRSGTVGVWAGHKGQKYYDDLRVRTLDGQDLSLPQLGSVVLSEHFNTYKVNDNPENWQDTSTDNGFGIDDALFKVEEIDGQLGFGTSTRLRNIHSHYVTPDALDWTNYTYSGRMYSDSNSAGVTFFSRYPEFEDSYYRLRAYEDQPTFHIAPHPDPGRKVNQRNSDSGVTMEPETWYRFYIEVEDTESRTNIRAKVWLDGSVEPSNFQIDTFDRSDNRLRSGTVGVWSNDDGASYYDDLVVQPLLPRSVALRALFVDQQPRKAIGVDNVLLPGTMIALVSPRSVTIAPDGADGESYTWKKESLPAFDKLSIGRIRSLLEDGELSLLLLEANPTDWPTQRRKPPAFTCINGEINLEQLDAQNDGDRALFERLTLDIDAPLGARPGASDIGWRIGVHSSGATLFGGIHLPWMDVGSQVNAPFLLTRLISTDRSDQDRPQYRLRAEVERLSPTEQENWIRAWRDLSRYLNPRNPLNGFGFADRSAPIWTTLEITDPLNVPSLFWHIEEWRSTPQIRFAPGEINLLLSDRQPYDQEQPPTTLATISPTAEVPLMVDEEDGTLTIELIVGEGDENIENFIDYTAKPTTKFEEINFPDFELAFDAVETPRLLRNTLGRPTPEEISGAGDDLESEPILWGFVPLADGWAQLPVPNMTERLYFEAQAKTKQNDDTGDSDDSDDTESSNGASDGTTQGDDRLAGTDSPSILQGALGLGNSYPDTLIQHPNEQPWDMTITSLQCAKGTWTLKRSGDGFELTDVSLRLEEPEIIANGFFWLSSGRPTAGDALPDLENWVNGLRQVPLLSRSRLPESQSPIVRLNFDAVTLQLRDFDVAPSAHLGQWSLHYLIHQETLDGLAEVKTLINETLAATPPLVWRRHPTVPTIQALPLTQTLSPPNFPSASRQLAPYQLAIDELTIDELAWEIGVAQMSENGSSAAAQWPQVLNESRPAAEWVRHPDLPMAALTLPGLTFDPDTQLPNSGLVDPQQTLLPARYRFDLPYTDQLNALAQVPKEPRDPNEVSPLPDSPPPQLAKPLDRSTLDAHWQRLSEQASLASIAAADALILNETNQTTIQKLIEPLSWPVDVNLDLTKYPGLIQINNAEQPLSSPLELRTESALEGISGRFVDATNKPNLVLLTDENTTDGTTADGTTADGYIVRAGSMQSCVIDDGLRDQRGLYRKLTQHHAADNNLLFTEVTLNGDPTLESQENRTYHLMTLLQATGLKISDEETWQFWLKDLPAEIGSDGANPTKIFERDAILSPILRKLEPADQAGSIAAINDPEVLSREQNYRMGYEWRLGHVSNEVEPAKGEPLRLNGLVFFPLTLELVEFDDAKIIRLEIVGRLQLPLAAADGEEVELTDLSNAVRLVYTENQSSGSANDAEMPSPALALADIQVESPVIEWPLQLKDGEQTSAPRIEWNRIRLGENQSIIIGSDDADLADAAKCRYVLFSQEWCVSLGELTFEAGADALTIIKPFEQAQLNRALIPHDLSITLDRSSGLHAAALRLQIRTGQIDSPDLEALVRFDLVPPVPPKDESTGSGDSISDDSISDDSDSADDNQNDESTSASTVHLESAILFGQLAIQTDDQSIQYVPESLQFVWETCSALDDGRSTIHFMPGMELGGTHCPGFLALTFDAKIEKSSPDAATHFPTLHLTSAFSEALFEAQWGTFSQTQANEFVPFDKRFEQRFGSSAGEIFIGYTTQWTRAEQDLASDRDLDNGSWDPSFLLNGFMEVKNLISWPANPVIDEEERLFTLPAPLMRAGNDSLLNHLHHTIRILLNQQPIPVDALARYSNDSENEGNAPPCIFTLSEGHSWQFLAVVEHQLSETQLTKPTIETGTGTSTGTSTGTESINTDFVILNPEITHLSERRWTALQEVRLLRPQTFAEFLAEDDTQTIDPVNGIAPRWHLYGHFHPAWATRLGDKEATDSLYALDPDTLIVEASAPHWIRTQSVEELLGEQTDLEDETQNGPTPTGTTLQFLPNGSQSGILSGLQDYGPSKPSEPAWQLLTMPFLGRLQPSSQDRSSESVPVDSTLGDTTTVGLSAPSHPLQIDPVLQLWRKTQDNNLDISPLVYMLTSWSVEADVRLRFSEFEHAVSRTWSRLDPLSLEENWFRLQNPLPEPVFERVRSVMAALPDTPARLSRATALRKAFDAFRGYYPPQLVAFEEDSALGTELGKAPVWREDRLLLWQAGLQGNSGAALAYPWLPVALQIWTSPLSEPSPSPQPHHVAATLIPARLEVNGQANPVPVSFAVSPYLGLSHHPAPDGAELFMASLELLGLDATTSQLRPIATLLREEDDPEELERIAVEWGYETRRRERPASPIGIVRRRHLEKPPMNENGASPQASTTEIQNRVKSALLIATYGFSLVQGPENATRLTNQVVAMRSEIRELRYREGQFGGDTMPSDMMPYEVAPPLVNGVQPIYLVPTESSEDLSTDDPLSLGVIDVAEAEDGLPRALPTWRWGLSALTTGVQYTGSQPSAENSAENNASKVGVTGRVPETNAPVTLWWHAPQHHVQFRSAVSDIGLTGGLPPLFRAKAINSLLPALSHFAFPNTKALQDSAGREEDRAKTDSLTYWQPVLPGSLSYLLVGARAGAMLAMRNQLLSQRGLLFRDDALSDDASANSVPLPMDTLVSGSVPVQHRVPRPVPLPANREDQQATALQTWSSYATPTQTVMASLAPVDEAFFAECGEEPNRTPMRRLQMQMVTPKQGEINTQWDGTLEFEFRDEENELTRNGWSLHLEIVDGTVTIPLEPKNAESGSEPKLATVWGPEPAKTSDVSEEETSDDNGLKALRRLIGNKQIGQTILVQAHVQPDSESSNFRQTLSFPLRLVDDRQLRLPLEPRFTFFEDPEYNRRLASLAGRFAMPVQIKSNNDESELLLQTVSLSTDRREYNPTSIVWLRYDWDDEVMQESEDNRAILSLQKVDKNNNPFDLNIVDGNPTAVLKTGQHQIYRLDLNELKPRNPDDPSGISPGDSLLIKVALRTPDSNQADITQDVEIATLVKDQMLELQVNIVAEPVIPLPDAAYGLLRQQNVDNHTEVECVRFAWGPDASRIDLICPDDLLQEVVRRRAVFQWTDSVRPFPNDEQNQDVVYEVQKIAENGATHFPTFGQDVF